MLAFVNGFGCICEKINVNLCGLGEIMLVSVDVREWVWLNVCGSTCESVCWGADIHVNVGVREWVWLNVHELTCEYICLGGANLQMNGVWACMDFGEGA